MASGVYTQAKYLIGAGDLDWNSSSVIVRAMLMAPAYTFSNAHQYVSDVSASEVSDASYARVTAATKTVSLDLGGGRALFDLDDIIFPMLSTVTVAGVVLYQQIGGDDATPADDPLICFIEVSPDVVADGSNLLIQFDPSGLLELL